MSLQRWFLSDFITMCDFSDLSDVDPDKAWSRMWNRELLDSSAGLDWVAMLLFPVKSFSFPNESLLNSQLFSESREKNHSEIPWLSRIQRLSLRMTFQVGQSCFPPAEREETDPIGSETQGRSWLVKAHFINLISGDFWWWKPRNELIPPFSVLFFWWQYYFPISLLIVFFSYFIYTRGVLSVARGPFTTLGLILFGR